MANDKNGKPINFGDYCALPLTGATIDGTTDGAATIVRVIQIRQTTKGVIARGAYVSLSSNGRVARVDFRPGDATLVMRSDGGGVA